MRRLLTTLRVGAEWFVIGFTVALMLLAVVGKEPSPEAFAMMAGNGACVGVAAAVLSLFTKEKL
jgi:hypothetical protein